MRDDGFEAFHNRHTAPDTCRKRRVPAATLCHGIEHQQMPRTGLQMVAAERDWIDASGMRKLIDEGFIIKALLRRIDRAPRASGLVRHMLVMPPRNDGQIVYECGFAFGAFRLGIVVLPRRNTAIRANRAFQLRRTLRAIRALTDFFLTAPDKFDGIGQLHGQLGDLLDDFHIHRQTTAKTAAD